MKMEITKIIADRALDHLKIYRNCIKRHQNDCQKRRKKCVKNLTLEWNQK